MYRVKNTVLPLMSTAVVYHKKATEYHSNNSLSKSDLNLSALEFLKQRLLPHSGVPQEFRIFIAFKLHTTRYHIVFPTICKSTVLPVL